MSSLRSALEEWLVEDGSDLPTDQLADDLVELEVVSGLIEAIRVDRIGRFEERGGHRARGYPSMTAFLEQRCRMSAGRASRLVAAAHAGRIAGKVFRSWLATRISTDQAHRLFEAAAAVPEEFTAAEEGLTAAVENLSHAGTRRVLSYWRQSVDGPGSLADESKQLDARGISASTSLDGMVRVDGWMTPLAGKSLLAALDALMPPPRPDDARTPRQRRHDALEDLARDFLDHADTPIVGGEKPHVNVVCDIPALQGIAGGRHETESGEVLTIAQLRTITCDCSLSRIVLGANSEIIDVGRKTRIVPAAMRRAVIARDRHCTWRGCERDPRWCDVHHVQHWGDLGETELDNLRLLCRYHHTLTHQLEAQGRRAPPAF